jgi:hypothetical protein
MAQAWNGRVRTTETPPALYPKAGGVSCCRFNLQGSRAGQGTFDPPAGRPALTRPAPANGA